MFKIPVKPLTVNQCFRSIKGRSIKSKKYRDFEKEINKHLPDELLREFAFQYDHNKHYIRAEYYFSIDDLYTKSKRKKDDIVYNKGCISRTSGDVDNYVKAYQDLLFKRLREFNVTLDDSQVLESKQVKTFALTNSITTILTLGSLQEFKSKLQVSDIA